MNKEAPISGLNLHFMALMVMIDNFKKNNISGYFEVVDEDEIPFKKIALINHKIRQILILMLEYEYYNDSDTSIDQLQSILQYAFNYMHELHDFKSDKEE